MAPLRLRHPKGVSTIDVDLDTATVSELQHLIFSITEIQPSQQDLRCGYPPRQLTLVPDLPVESLGIGRGEQLVVNELKTAASAPTAVARQQQTQSQAAKPPSKPSPGSSASQEVASVSVNGGILVHRVVPDDNSCLFASIGLIFEQNMAAASDLRKVAGNAIKNDWDTWNEAVLGRPREEYISIILKPSTWGGAIELSIFAKHYKTEICSIDVETGRVDRFGSDSHYSSRCIVLYSGIHYDAVSLSPFPDAPGEFHETMFKAEDEGVLEAAGRLASVLRERKAYTNTATFDLKCQVCGQGLKGEKEARAHASQTGHTQFGEY